MRRWAAARQASAQRTPPDLRAARGLPARSPSTPRASLGTPRQTCAQRTPPDLRAARGLPARSPSTLRASLGVSPRSPARPCRPRTSLRSGDHDHRHRSHNPRRPHTTHQSGHRPPAPPQARPTGSQRDKTLPDQHISRSNGTKLSLLIIKRSFWPVLRMQGEFYPGYDIHGPQQGEFCPGILVAHGLLPGSAMIIHVFLARQRSSVPHSGVTVWWSARLIWVRSPCDPSRKLSTSDSK